MALCVFRAVAISQGWKKGMYLSKVPNHLRGLANKWYYDQYFQSMEEFEAEFIARFTNDLTPQQAMKKMLSLKQGSNETVEEYTERFLTIRMKCGHMANDISGFESLYGVRMANSYVRGIQPSVIRALVMSAQPKSLKEAIHTHFSTTKAAKTYDFVKLASLEPEDNNEDTFKKLTAEVGILRTHFTNQSKTKPDNTDKEMQMKALRQRVTLSPNDWTLETVYNLKIRIRDCSLVDMFGQMPDVDDYLFVPEWQSGKWLSSTNVENLRYVSLKVKYFMSKVKEMHLKEEYRRDRLATGFVHSFLDILEWLQSTWTVRQQFEYSITMNHNVKVAAKSDYFLVGPNGGIVIVIEDNTLTKCTANNNWKGEAILGEMFVAAHRAFTNANDGKFPNNIFAILEMGTRFTFYKAMFSEKYIRESMNGMPSSEMIVWRHPPADSPRQAYDMCFDQRRKAILRCMLAIENMV